MRSTAVTSIHKSNLNQLIFSIAVLFLLLPVAGGLFCKKGRFFHGSKYLQKSEKYMLKLLFRNETKTLFIE